MQKWWHTQVPKGQVVMRAVAYYRHSAEIGQENSVEIQQDNVQAFAKKYGFKIIHEYADRGKSGLTAEGRPEFQKLMNRVETDNSFDYILCLDVSRWGRFQNTDIAAHYEALCAKYGKQVIYVSHGMTEREEDILFNQLRKSLDRFQAGEYSRVLSKKVFDGAVKVARQGYRPGASAPYGMTRLMLDEHKKPDRILQPGQRKAIQNGRIVLVPGDPQEIAVINEIYLLFTQKEYSEKQIVGHLNDRGIPSPGGVRWNTATVHFILTNAQYAGAVVYNRTSQKLKKKRRDNPEEKWVVTPNSYESIIGQELFQAAQDRILLRKRRFSREEMQVKIQQVYEKYGMLTSSLLHGIEDVPPRGFLIKEFGSIPQAFDSLFPQVVERAKDDVFSQIASDAKVIDTYDNFLVINERFSIKIQPAVALPRGYGYSWHFPIDQRVNVDVTLGVPLSDKLSAEEESREILGYFPLPRVMAKDQQFFSLTDNAKSKMELHGYSGLDFIRELMK